MSLDRRIFLAGLSALAAGRSSHLLAQSAGIDTHAILNDPEAPVSGNLTGDVTIVAFLDYNCPFCKKAAPDLARLLREDGNIRLVYKDWPVIAETSVFAAQLALASVYQGAYDRVHAALMAAPGMRLKQEQFLAAVEGANADMARLQSDLTANSAKITALLRRNMAQADALGLQGTPTYLIGPFRTSTQDYAGFKQVVADARKKQASR